MDYTHVGVYASGAERGIITRICCKTCTLNLLLNSENDVSNHFAIVTGLLTYEVGGPTLFFTSLRNETEIEPPVWKICQEVLNEYRTN